MLHFDELCIVASFLKLEDFKNFISAESLTAACRNGVDTGWRRCARDHNQHVESPNAAGSDSTQHVASLDSNEDAFHRYDRNRQDGCRDAYERVLDLFKLFAMAIRVALNFNYLSNPKRRTTIVSLLI
jgi:hypothetical protein